jgi:hypothetical protein
MSIEYFKKQLDKDRVTRENLADIIAEPVVSLLFGTYFLINLFTDFFLDDFPSFGYFCIFAPVFTSLIATPIILTTKSKQKGRLPSGLSNIFLGACWAYLFSIDRWYEASELWLVGSFMTNDIFYWLVLGGVIVPPLVGISSLVIYFGVRREQNII